MCPNRNERSHNLSACQVILEIGSKAVETREVILADGASDTITFKVSEDVTCIYSISINGLSGLFIVKPVAISELATISTPSATHTLPLVKPIN